MDKKINDRRKFVDIYPKTILKDIGGTSSLRSYFSEISIPKHLSKL